MIKTNHDIWGIMDSGTRLDLGKVNILHLPTMVENAKGDTVIRGFYGTSLRAKIEVEVNTDFLLDMVSTVETIILDPMHEVIPPQEYVNTKRL